MRANSIQFLTYAAVLSAYMFIPNLAQDMGASRFEIGVIVAAYGLAVFVSSYLFGRLADIRGRELILRIGLLISAGTFFLQIFMNTLAMVLVIRILTGMSVGIYPAALVSHIHDRKKSVGKFSSYGSLGWAFGTFVAGVIAVYNGIFLFSSALFFLAFLISFKLEMKHERVSVPFFPVSIFRKNFSVYASFFFRFLGAVTIWAIFPLYLAELGADKFWIGVLFFANTFVQFIVMQFVDRFKSERMIQLGLGLSTLAFISYAFASNYMQVIPIQILLGVSWGTLYAGSLIHLMNKNVEKATAAGIFNSLIGLSGIFGPLIGGFISQVWGFNEVMYFAAVSSAIGFIIFLRR